MSADGRDSTALRVRTVSYSHLFYILLYAEANSVVDIECGRYRQYTALYVRTVSYSNLFYILLYAEGNNVWWILNADRYMIHCRMGPIRSRGLHDDIFTAYVTRQLHDFTLLLGYIWVYNAALEDGIESARSVLFLALSLFHILPYGDRAECMYCPYYTSFKTLIRPSVWRQKSHSAPSTLHLLQIFCSTVHGLHISRRTTTREC